MMKRKKLQRWVLAAAFLGMLLVLGAPTADAGCMRCSLGLCISAHYDGADSCTEVIIVYGFPPTYTCALSGVCDYEGENEGGPCTDGCDPEHQN